MDDLTRERYPDGVPWVERRRRPVALVRPVEPADWSEILERRRILNEAMAKVAVSA